MRWNNYQSRGHYEFPPSRPMSHRPRWEWFPLPTARQRLTQCQYREKPGLDGKTNRCVHPSPAQKLSFHRQTPAQRNRFPPPQTRFPSNATQRKLPREIPGAPPKTRKTRKTQRTDAKGWKRKEGVFPSKGRVGKKHRVKCVGVFSDGAVPGFPSLFTLTRERSLFFSQMVGNFKWKHVKTKGSRKRTY